jgi:hypothetical protein
MRKLILLAVIIMVRLTAFSQQSTTGNEVIDTTSIVISKTVAREIIKDLLRKDLLTEENRILQAGNSLLLNNIALKDSILSKKDSMLFYYRIKEEALNTIISQQKLQITEYQFIKSECDTLLKNNKKLKTTLTVQRIIGTIFLATLTVFSVSR